jgi:hypothetical protein
MITMDITLDSSLLQQLASRLPLMFGQKVAPATATAFNTSTRLVQGVWRGWAMGGPVRGIPNIKTPSGRLAASIKVNKAGAFDATIETSSPQAQRIQDGTPELDMKTTHPYGKKSRVSKEGVPYLIIPFRWGTPNKDGGARAHFGNVIPQVVYPMVKQMGKSFRRDKRDDGSQAIHVEKNYSGQDVPRSEYYWPKENGRYEGEGNMNGMVRMNKETKGGGSTYYTFRVISAWQLVTAPHSWIRKAVPAIDVVGAVENETRPLVEELIQAGLDADFGT